VLESVNARSNMCFGKASPGEDCSGRTHEEGGVDGERNDAYWGGLASLGGKRNLIEWRIGGG